MRQGRYTLLLALALGGAFLAGRMAAATGTPAAAGVLLLLVLGASLVLPGPPALWAELLGTAALWPVMGRALPPEMVCAGLTFLPPVLLRLLWAVLTLLVSTLGPMLFFLLAGDWLDPRPRRRKKGTGRSSRNTT